jgi:hypothetical protein
MASRVPETTALFELVGARGFEPRTPCAQGRCATRLRYAPTDSIINDAPQVTFVTLPEG